jgi:glucose-6-phosphate isomerase
MTALPHVDLTGAWHNPSGVEPADLSRLGALLDKLRDEICDVDEKILAGDIRLPPSKHPLQAGFTRLPERMLNEYQTLRTASELGRMLAATKQLMTDVDRIVVVGDADCLSGPQALMQACCQPFFNELTRGQRGSRPRLYFTGASLDNDAFQGLLYLLGAHHRRPATTVEQRWGLVVLAPHGSPSNRLLRPLQNALLDNCGGDLACLRSRILSVSCQSERPPEPVDELGLLHHFVFPETVANRYSVLSMAGLLPAALLGINIMKLLEGAQAISRHFCAAPSGENLVLQWAGVNFLLDQQYSPGQRCWCRWNHAFDGIITWYRRLLYGSLGKELQVLEPSDLQQNRSGPPTGHRWFNQLVSPHARFDPLQLEEPTDLQEVRLHANSRLTSDATWSTAPNLPADMTAALTAQCGSLKSILRSQQWPVTELSVPQIDDLHVGQILQLLMLSTVVEGRMMGINPYA